MMTSYSSKHGGSPGLRDETLLGASLARPQHLLAYNSPDQKIQADLAQWLRANS